MRQELREFVEAGRRFEAAWDEDRVKVYPSELPSLDELVAALAAIEVRSREEQLIHLLTVRGLWRADQDYWDPHTGAVFVVGRHIRLGVDHGINNAWQVYLYWDAEDSRGLREERFTNAGLGPDGLDLDPQASPKTVVERLEPLIRAIRAGL